MLPASEPPSCSTEAAMRPVYLHTKKGKRRRGSLEAAVVQSLALGVTCTTAAYPSWVVVRVDSLHFVLGIICVLNHVEPSSNCHFVGRAGLAFMSLTALCCLLALLSSCGAMLLDILGLKVGRVTAPFLHGLVVLFTAMAVLSSCGLWALTRHGLRTAERPQLLGHSSVFGSSFYFCILACALAVVATGWSYAAWAHVDLSVTLCLASTSRQQSHPVPVDEHGSANNIHCFETGLPLAACVAFLQRETESQAEPGLPSKQGGAEPPAEEGAHLTHEETSLQLEEGLTPKQENTCPDVPEDPHPTKEN